MNAEDGGPLSDAAHGRLVSQEEPPAHGIPLAAAIAGDVRQGVSQRIGYRDGSGASGCRSASRLGA
jgi:hypothetical protein